MERFLHAIQTFELPTWEQVSQRCMRWLFAESPTWAISALGHACALVLAALIGGRISTSKTAEVPTFEALEDDAFADQELQRFEVGDPPLEPSELTTESLMEWEAKPIAQEAQYNDDSPIFEESGGGTPTGTAMGAGLGFDVPGTGLGPVLSGGGGVDLGLGMGQNAGRGGAGTGFGLRGSGHREAVPGVTKASERAVGAALSWLVHHQARDGNWSLSLKAGRSCSCSGAVNSDTDAAATAMGILPFLGAGQTHMTKGPYQKSIHRALTWLIKNQKANGDLSSGTHQMYSHGLATIALCEAYGMTQDSRIGYAAQAAVNFIESAQNNQGGWRYTAGAAMGDTSVFGWQLMALRSAQIAGLKVGGEKFDLCRQWLTLVSDGYQNGKFAYQPGNAPKPSMTAVGMLGLQYLGARRNDPALREAMQYVLDNPPDARDRDIYYWYYATLAMHNVPGPEWDTWNRQIRKLLIETQDKQGCPAGSWNPKNDAWGHLGGRLMVTSLSALTLEVYYRYLPLYNLDREDLEQPKAVASASAE
jgi:hypothetical protein